MATPAAAQREGERGAASVIAIALIWVILGVALVFLLSLIHI